VLSFISLACDALSIIVIGCGWLKNINKGFVIVKNFKYISSLIAGLVFITPVSAVETTKVFNNANIIASFGQEPIMAGRIVIEGQKIKCVGSEADCPITQDASIHNYQGQWIMPALVDSHVHYSQNGWVDSRPGVVDVREHYPYEPLMAKLKRNPQRWHQSHLCTGVTASFDAAGYPYVLELNKLDRNAPQVIAAGPAFAPMQGGFASLPGEQFLITMDSEQKIIDSINYLVSLNAAGVKVAIFPLPEPLYSTMVNNLKVLINEAKKHSLPVAVHATSLKEAKLAITLGASRLLHSVGDKQLDKEFIKLAKDNQVYYTPTLMVGRGYASLKTAMLSGQPMAVPNALGCVDQQVQDKFKATANILPQSGQDQFKAQASWKKYQQEYQLELANLLSAYKAGITIAFGTDSGNPGSPHGGTAYDELKAMVSAGLPASDVLKSATIDAAKSIGLADELGSLTKGKRADFLILAKDPRETIENFQGLHTVVHLGIPKSQQSLRH
jgi:imidazolonepropionase-like amidohydrolase